MTDHEQRDNPEEPRSSLHALRLAIDDLQRMIAAMEERDQADSASLEHLLSGLLNAQIAIAQAQVLALIQRVPNDSQETMAGLDRLRRLIGNVEA